MLILKANKRIVVKMYQLSIQNVKSALVRRLEPSAACQKNY